jgi:glycosyltransferase involved in cell wall biosynthesis
MSRRDRSSVYRRMKAWIVRAARPVLVSPSRWLADRVREIDAYGNLEVSIVRPPIDLRTFSPACDRGALRKHFGLHPRAPTVVLAGANWKDPMKGGDHAVRCLSRARAQLPTLQALIVGDGADALLADAGVSGRALPFEWSRPGLADVFRCGDVCLFPSRAENYPLTTLESMACGTPVLAFSVGGIVEQIGHRRSGCVAATGNEAALSGELIWSLSDIDRSRAMGAAARSFVERTSDPRRVADEYERLYRRALRRWTYRTAAASPRYRPSRRARHIARWLGWPTCAALHERPGEWGDEA